MKVQHMPLLFLLFLWFFAEISTFIMIGGEIGAGGVILEIIMTIMIGSWIVRKSVAQGMLVKMTMGGGGLIGAVLGGILLIIPGFITDALGLLSLLPCMLSIVIAILGLGRKVNMDDFVKSRMGVFYASKGQNPFGGKNPFSNAGTQQENTQRKTKSQPIDGDIIDGDVVRKFEKKD